MRIHGRVFGLGAGLHGIHVLTVGDTSDNCLAAGGHFNPDAVRPKLPMQMSGWQMANILGGTWGKVWSSPFSHLPLSSYSKIEPDMMQIRCKFCIQIITSCNEKESHAGDLGNLKVHLVLCTPEGRYHLCTSNIQVTVFGEARIDIVDTSLTLGDGGAR